jgi:hypothetical protein
MLWWVGNPWKVVQTEIVRQGMVSRFVSQHFVQAAVQVPVTPVSYTKYHELQVNIFYWWPPTDYNFFRGRSMLPSPGTGDHVMCG